MVGFASAFDPWGGALTSALTSPSPAAEFTCQGILEATTLDHLLVTDSATCNLNGTQVMGNITVESGAALIARAVRVDGDLQSENAAQVTVMGRSTIKGDLLIQQSGGATVLNSRIDGNLQFEDNTQPLISEGNRIGGNLQAVGNQGGLKIFTNRIGGNLQCKNNRPAPTGNGNVVRGIKADQCDRF